MERRGSGLASRFRQALGDAMQARQSEEERRKARMEEGRRARDALFEDLVAFATDTGFVAARVDADGVTLRFRERWVQFRPVDDGEAVQVQLEGAAADEHRLYREPMLGDRWVWAWRRRGVEDRVPLFDKGLEDLLVRGLGLPRPGDAPTPPAPPVEEPGGSRRKL